jgi:hypothetical protein
MAALLYFGDFIDGELELGASFCKTVPVKNGDLVFINSSHTYHRSLAFLGNRINLIFYSSIIKRRDLIYGA